MKNDRKLTDKELGDIWANEYSEALSYGDTDEAARKYADFRVELAIKEAANQ